MFDVTSYPGSIGAAAARFNFLGGGDPDCVNKPWKKGCGAAVSPGRTPPPAPDQPPIGGPPATIPTTEPNQCPPGMTYSPPPPGSGTGTCTGSIIPGQGVGPTPGSGSPTTGGTDSLSSILGSISPTWLLIGGAIALFLILRK